MSRAPFPPFNGIARIDERARAAYAEGAGIFRILPAAVAIPSTTRALCELVRWAAAERVPLVPRGAGSGMAGGNVGSGVILDLTALDGNPLRLEPASRRAQTGAGVTLRALNGTAARYGLRLPPDPSSARFATLGGMLATNAAGARTVKSGSVRRWVEALTLVTADAEPVTLRRGDALPPGPLAGRIAGLALQLQAAASTIRSRFPGTLKNSTGYALDAWLDSGDLLDLVVGSEGTLGCIVSAEWRLEPVPLVLGGIRAALGDTDRLGQLARALRALEPAALEYLDATFLALAGEAESGAAGLLMVEFESEDPDRLRDALTRARALLEPHAANFGTASGRAELERLWAIRHAASPMLASQGEALRSLQVIEDACVPLDAAGAYIRAVRAAGARHRLPLVIFGHLGDGNLHVNLQPDVSEPDWEERVQAIFREVSAVVLELGGTLSGEHGDGRLRAGYLEARYGREVVALFRAVKQAFDPDGIFNPGVKLPISPDPALGSLKLGRSAAPLPADLEAGLREIERSAGYAQSRLELADRNR